jgi:hypothetical protein
MKTAVRGWWLVLPLVAAMALLVVVVRTPTASQAVRSDPSVEATTPPSTTAGVPADSCIVYRSVPSDICVPHGTPLPTPTQISTVYVAFLNATAARNNNAVGGTSSAFRTESLTQFEAFMAPEIAADNQYIAVLHSIPWPAGDRYDISVLTYYVNGDITFLSGATCSGTCNWFSLNQPWGAVQQSITTAVNHVLADLGLPSSVLNGYVSTAPTTTTTTPPPTTTTTNQCTGEPHVGVCA